MKYQLLHLLNTRHFSSNKRPVNIVLGPLLPRNITNTRNFQKYWKKTSFKPIEVDDISLDNPIDNINNPNLTFNVGYFDQYPSKSNKNCSEFTNNFLINRMPKRFWFSNDENLKINVKYPIDYYPFNYTYKKSKNNSKQMWMKDKKITLSSIGIKSKIEDALNDDLPILVRKIDKKRKQILLCFRDKHSEIGNINRIETLINEYKPDLIILEYPIINNVFKVYQSLLYKYCVYPYLRFIQRLIPKQYETKFGQALGKIIPIITRLNIPTAYAANTAIMMSLKHNINLCLADYPEQIRNLICHLEQVLDLYQADIYARVMKGIGFGGKMGELERKRIVPEKLLNLISARISPHMVSIADFRNDLMALAINESIEDNTNKILFITGGAHWLDMRDKLCGNTDIINPFKEITKEHVVLKQRNALHYGGHSKIKLNEKEIKEYIDLVGINMTALLMIPQENYKTFEDIKNAMQKWIINWNEGNCTLK